MSVARLRDVATAAGVSISTVSAVLNGRTLNRYPESTQERVRQAARAVGYRPNNLARDLRSTRTRLIGMVSDLITTTPYAHQLVEGAQAVAAASGHMLVVVSTGREAGDPWASAQALRDYRVQGIVFASMTQRAIELPAESLALPVVLANERDVEDRHPAVIGDEKLASHTATQHLISAGHGAITYLGFAGEGLLGPTLRQQGYEEAMGGANLKPRVVVGSTFTTRAARTAMADHLAGSDRPTAVVCANDQLAMGVYQAAQARRLQIPRDLSVVGYGDWRLLAEELDPPLTTMAIPYAQIGATAVDLLIRRLDGSEILPGPHVLPMELIERDSVAPPVA